VTEKYPGGINCYLELILVLSDTHHQHPHELSFSCIGKQFSAINPAPLCAIVLILLPETSSHNTPLVTHTLKKKDMTISDQK
jgi:hypothetical protein